MATTFHCPSCSKEISADAPAGTRVACPLCGAVVDVPDPSAAAARATPAQHPVPPAVPQPARQGMATASLVFGILGVVITICAPVFGLLGLILGIVALRRTNRDSQQYGGRGLAIAGICTGGISFALSVVVIPLMIAILLPSLARAREVAKRSVCANNLRQVGNALYTYANVNGDVFPPDLDVLVDNASFSPKTLICPSSDSDEIAYIYIPGLTTDMDPDAPLAFEHLDNHADEGGNVLFGDAHVEWLDAGTYKELLAEHLAAEP